MKQPLVPGIVIAVTLALAATVLGEPIASAALSVRGGTSAAGTTSCVPGVKKVDGGLARTFCGSARATVVVNRTTRTFTGGQCELHPSYVVVNIGTAGAGKKPYFGLLMGKHPAATAADPVVAKDGVYTRGLVTAKGPGFSLSLYNDPTLKIVLTSGRRRGTFSAKRPASTIFGTPAQTISGRFSC